MKSKYTALIRAAWYEVTSRYGILMIDIAMAIKLAIHEEIAKQSKTSFPFDCYSLI